jgi:uncharacterized surface protein with fasciclin (FAS1) repeats
MFKSAALLSLAVLVLGTSCDKLPNSPAASGDLPVVTPSATPELKDIVDTAVAAGSFNTLAGLLSEAGLIDTLKGAGPFTVFAPNDAAFAKIPAADLAALKSDREKLKKVLLYHVLAAKVAAADAPANADVATVATATVKIVKENGVVKVNNATVTNADIMAKNGVIHVIDTVLMPPM